MTHAPPAGKDDGAERGIYEVREGSSSECRSQPWSQGGARVTSGFGVTHVNCPGGPGTARYPGWGAFRAKTGTVAGKPELSVSHFLHLEHRSHRRTFRAVATKMK